MSGNQLDNIVELLKSQSGSTESFESVTTWAELPAAATVSGSLYLVRQNTGVPLVSYHGSGWYRSNGATWDKLADYDPTATNSALTDIKATLEGTLTVSVANLPVTQPVSGTVAVSNLPATQPVSGSVSVSNLPATQPVSGTVAVSNHPASQAVTGTFFQATQPVSLASAPTTPVTGTFFQATQPVSAAALPLPSGASTEATLALIKAKTDNLDVALSTRTKPADSQTVTGSVSVSNLPATQAVSAAALPLPTGAATETTVAAISTKTPALGQAAMAASTPVVIASNQSAVPVSGTFFQATQPVSLAVAPTTPVTGTFFQATQPVSLAAAPTTPVTGTFWQATQPVSLAVAPTTPVTGTFFQATQPVSGTVTITPPTLTKGTQGATGLSTQDLKDAGRNVTNYFMAAGVAGTNAEVMQSLTGYKSGAAVVATATPAVVTAGKTYRITSVTLSYQSLATAGACLFRLRANLSGTGAVGSPLVMTFTVGSLAAVAGVTNTLDIPFPDGLEFAAGTGIAVGMVGLSAVGAALAAGFGTITIYGYEY